MTVTVFLAVLAAALMHAIWNAVIKVRGDRFSAIAITSLGMALTAVPVLPFVDVPTATVWPWIIASVIIHIGYRLFLVKAYDSGDLAQTYPLARGTAPLLTAFGAMALNSEVPGGSAMLGILLLSCGTVLMSLRGGVRIDTRNRHAVGYALITAVLISAYTLTDGNGARSASTASSYAAWLFLCDGLAAFAIGAAVRGRALVAILMREWRPCFLAGGLTAGSYWIAMWAMTQAPIATVAALRESSVFFALLISVTFLGESVTRWRVAASAFILVGAVALRLG